MIITAAEAEVFLGAQAGDPLVARLVAAVDAFVKRFCGLTFERQEAFVQELGAFGKDIVFLNEYPLAAITEIRLDCTGEFPDDTIQTDLTKFVIEGKSRDRIRYLGGRFSDGARVVQVTGDVGYWPADDPQNTPKMPEDLRSAALELVAAKYRPGSSERMKSESLGSHSYTRFDGTDPMILDVLKAYRRNSV